MSVKVTIASVAGPNACIRGVRMKIQGSFERGIDDLAVLAVTPLSIYQDVTTAWKVDLTGE